MLGRTRSESHLVATALAPLPFLVGGPEALSRWIPLQAAFELEDWQWHWWPLREAMPKGTTAADWVGLGTLRALLELQASDLPLAHPCSSNWYRTTSESEVIAELSRTEVDGALLFRGPRGSRLEMIEAKRESKLGRARASAGQRWGLNQVQRQVLLGLWMLRSGVADAAGITYVDVPGRAVEGAIRERQRFAPDAVNSLLQRAEEAVRNRTIQLRVRTWDGLLEEVAADPRLSSVASKVRSQLL